MKVGTGKYLFKLAVREDLLEEVSFGQEDNKCISEKGMVWEGT